MHLELLVYLRAFVGGLLIGGAALFLYLTIGRIAGISGILADALTRKGTGLARFWRLAFLAGLTLVAPVASALGLGKVSPPLEDNLLILIGAGLLVGYGTRLGSGCTSGHAVCGMGRLSLRSIVATAVFMAVAMVVVFLRRHVWGM